MARDLTGAIKRQLVHEAGHVSPDSVMRLEVDVTIGFGAGYIMFPVRMAYEVGTSGSGAILINKHAVRLPQDDSSRLGPISLFTEPYCKTPIRVPADADGRRRILCGLASDLLAGYAWPHVLDALDDGPVEALDTKVEVMLTDPAAADAALAEEEAQLFDHSYTELGRSLRRRGQVWRWRRDHNNVYDKHNPFNAPVACTTAEKTIAEGLDHMLFMYSNRVVPTD